MLQSESCADSKLVTLRVANPSVRHTATNDGEHYIGDEDGNDLNMGGFVFMNACAIY